jgi:hypothetical protein
MAPSSMTRARGHRRRSDESPRTPTAAAASSIRYAGAAMTDAVLMLLVLGVVLLALAVDVAAAITWLRQRLGG